MEDTHLYSAREIETLRKKINIYRQTLTALQTGHSVDDPLFTQDEIKSDLPQISQVEGAVKKVGEEQNNPLDVYEQQFKDFFKQIEVLNDTVKELNQDLSEVVDKFNKEGEISPPVVMRETIATQESMEEMNVTEPSFMEGATQMERQPLMTAVSEVAHPPSFTQLHRLIRHANAVQEEKNERIPSENFTFPIVEKEELYNDGKGFPRMDRGPSQLSARRFGSVQMKTTVRITNAKQQQEFLMPMHQTVNQRPAQQTSEPPQDVRKEQPFEEELFEKISNQEQSNEPDMTEEPQMKVEVDERKPMEGAILEEESVALAPTEDRSDEVIPVSVETESVETTLLEEPLLESETMEEPQLAAELFEKQSVEVTLSEEEPLVMEALEKVSMETESIEKEPLEDVLVAEQQEKRQKQTLSLFRLFRKRE